jgi:flagellar biosynthesis protein FliQ
VCTVLQREAELNAVSSTWFNPFAALLEVHFTILRQQLQLYIGGLLSVSLIVYCTLRGIFISALQCSMQVHCFTDSFISVRCATVVQLVRIQTTDCNGATPLALAVRLGHTETVALLQDSAQRVAQWRRAVAVLQSAAEQV